MKNLLTLFAILVAGAMSSFAGTSTIVLNAGDLTTMNGTALPTGSLLLLVSAGTDGAFYDMLQAGQFTGGDDVLLGAQSVNNNDGGIQSTSNVFTFDSATAGQAVEIVWFSGFTYAQYLAGETPAAGQYYQTFAGLTSGVTNGGAAWVVPSAGSTSNLNFVTQSANDYLSLGYADAYSNDRGKTLLQVLTISVPEPGTYGAGVIALLALVVIARQKRWSSFQAS